MTRPICVLVLFGFFVQIIPPRGMSICHLYKYTNSICPGFFLWREGHLPPRGSTSLETTELLRLPCLLHLPPAIPFVQLLPCPISHDFQAARARARRSPLPPLPTLHIVGGAAKCRARGCGHHRAVVATTSTTTSHRPDRHSRRMRVDGVCNACVVVDDTSMFKYNQNVMHLKNEYFFRPPTRVAPLAPRIPSSSGTYRREPKRGPTTSWQIGR